MYMRYLMVEAEMSKERAVAERQKRAIFDRVHEQRLVNDQDCACLR
jgi:hypothetical protein